MAREQVVVHRHWVMMVAGIIGFILEFFLIPVPHRQTGYGTDWLRDLLTSGGLYYALAFPLAVWWWFRVFLRRKNLEGLELALAFFIFGFYVSSGLRAVAVTVVRLLHL
jgi:hypothetical protein